MYDYESAQRAVIKDGGVYLYQGSMTYDDLQKLMEIAKEKQLTAISPNEYISYIINHFYNKN